jgi:hypothetical protein
MNIFQKIRLLFTPRSWGLYYVMGKPVMCDDGLARDRYVMRRRDGDRIVYRALNDVEQRDHELQMAIK